MADGWQPRFKPGDTVRAISLGWRQVVIADIDFVQSAYIAEFGKACRVLFSEFELFPVDDQQSHLPDTQKPRVDSMTEKRTGGNPSQSV